MRLLFCAVVALACLTIFPDLCGSRACADDTPAQIAALEKQIADLESQIDALRAQAGQTSTPATLADAAVAALTGQCAAGGVAQRATVRVSVRTNERRGLFSRLRGRRGCG